MDLATRVQFLPKPNWVIGDVRKSTWPNCSYTLTFC